MYKTGRKVIASLLVFILTMAHLSTLGESIASSIEGQTTETNVANIKFDAYFKQGEEKVHSDTKTIGAENYIYVAIDVKNDGYLKDAKIELQDPNFVVSEELTTEQISKVDGNKIELNRITTGNTIEIAIPIAMIETNGMISPNEFNKQSNIKLTGTYVNGEGKEKQVEKNISISLKWTAELETQIGMKITKNFSYKTSGITAPNVQIPDRAIQAVVESYIKDNALPVKKHTIVINPPTLANATLLDVKVYANTTKATNGDETGITFTKDNYVYDKENNTLTITVKNELNKDGYVSWQKEAKDEFVVTFFYVTNSLNNSSNTITMGASNQMTTYGNTEEVIMKYQDLTAKVIEDTGDTVDFSIETPIKELSKGQIYANYDATNKIETEYEQIVTADVTVINNIENIILKQSEDSFIKPEVTEYKIEQSYYKRVTIDEKELKRVLGQNPEVIFYSETTEIAKINNETQSNEEGKYVVDLSEFNINTLKIQTSNPEAQGKIKFNIVKAIKADTGYTKKQMIDFKSLKLNLSAQIQYKDSYSIVGAINEKKYESSIILTEPTTQAELVIENNNLSTVTVNENVKFTAILKTDDLNCMLYENPILQIVLPKYIENIDVKNVEVLFGVEGTNLTIKGNQIQLIPNEDGTNTLSIELEGKQTAYMLGAVSKGINVVITSDITVNKFTANMEDKITMLYTNKNELDNGQAKQAQASIKVVAPVGMVTTTTISDYAENKEPVTVVSGQAQTVEIDTQATAKNAKFTMNVINNYNNTIENVAILGRTLFKGNKDIVTGEDLGSTIDMPLTSNITVSNIDASKVKVYYSENGEATKDLTNQANAWTETPTNLANVKSYLIVLTDVTMNTADGINFEYTAQIPENLSYNQSAYQAYVVYFNNNLAEGTIEDKQVATKLGVSTGRGSVLEAQMTSNIEEAQEVQVGKFIKYTLKVKNVGEEVAENVVATVNIPKCTNYIEFFEGESGPYSTDYKKKEITFEYGNLEPNKEVTSSFWVIVKNITVEDICNDDTHYNEYNGSKYHKSDIIHSDAEYKTTISTKATVVTKDLVNGIESNEVKNTVIKSYFNIGVATTTNGIENLRKGEDFTYTIYVTACDANKVLKNTILKTVIPEGLKYKNTEIKRFNLETLEYEMTDDKVNYNEETRELTINLGNVTIDDNREIKIISEVEELQENEYSKKITSVARVSADGINEETSNEIIDTIVKSAIKVSQTSTIPEGSKISANDKFSYKILIENIGFDQVTNIDVIDQLPSELQYIDTEYTINGETKTTTNIDENNITKLTVSIPKDGTAEIKINVSVKAISEQKEISNSAKISSEDISEIKTNEIKHIIEAFNYEDREDISSIKGKISGQVWKDSNNDGIKDENEEKVEGVELLLFDNSTGNLVRDDQGNAIKETTKEDGRYTFSNIPKGKYTVIFLYDTTNYSATIYRKESVDDTRNSDAVDSEITLDGVNRIAGITEEIDITNSNIYNVDLGLVSNPKFDLKLDKTVSKITVQDSTGTNVYDYKDTKLAKKDLVSKNINNTTIIVEYKIKVTNEGAISGFVKKIVDYIPSEMKFNSELNKDWYTSENGVLYNSSLANTIINPGESKEVTLTLTKKMTQDNLGIYHNEAEIYEAYNDLGIADVDSKAGNRVSNEDDISSADVVITVKTGEAILFVSLGISIIAIIGLGTYFIKKKVLR